MRSTTLLVLVAVMFIAAGGFIHLTEWLDVYRHVPASAPGAAVVRIGFPVNAAASLVLVFALVLLVRRPSRLTRPAIFTALVFQAASLATLIATRVDSAFGWSEPTWTPAAEQARAVEIAALAGLGALAAIHRRSSSSGKLQDVSAERTPIPSRAGRCGDHPVALRQP